MAFGRCPEGTNTCQKAKHAIVEPLRSGAARPRVSDLSKDEEWRFALRMVQARQRRIGAQLERLWDYVVREPVPDEMLELLKKLDEKDRGPHDA